MPRPARTLGRMSASEQWRSHPRRDRRGRGIRTDLIPAYLPGYTTRREDFDALVLDAISPLYARFDKKLEHVEVLVEEVPALPADSGGRPGRSAIVLGRFFPGDREAPARIVIYRRPIEARVHDREERAELIYQVIVDNVAAALGCRPEDIDPSLF